MPEDVEVDGKNFNKNFGRFAAIPGDYHNKLFTRTPSPLAERPQPHAPRRPTTSSKSAARVLSPLAWTSRLLA